MPPFVKIKSNSATDAGIRSFIFQPMIRDCTSWLLANAPREHPSPRVPDIHRSVISEIEFEIELTDIELKLSDKVIKANEMFTSTLLEPL